MNGRLLKLKQYCFAIKQISYKDNKRKVGSSNLGVIWNVLDPLIYMVVLSVYYQNVITHNVYKFPVYAFIGVTVLNFYRNATMGAMHSMVNNKKLIITTKLPLNIFVYQKIFVAFKEMIYSSVALVFIMLFFRVYFTLKIIEVIPVLFLTLVIIIGVGKFLSVIYVKFADIDHFYSIFMTLAFFVSETFIPVEDMPTWLHPILKQNPMYLSIHMIRNSVMYGATSEWYEWVKLIIWALVFLKLGNVVFYKSKNEILENI